MKFKLILVFLSSVMLSFFLLDIFLINFYKLGKPLKYFISPDFGFALRENQKMTRDGKNYITINNFGMRNKKDLINYNNKKIILFYGDSVLYGGSYVDDEDILSEKICKSLNITANKNKFFCGNYGVNAYGITNISERIQSINNGFKDNFTIVLITSGNIRRGKTSLSGQPFFSKNIKPPFKGIKEIALFYYDKIRINYRYSFSNKLANESYDKYYYQNINGEINQNIKDFYEREIEKLFYILENHSSDYLVVYLSSKNEYLNNENKIQKKILHQVVEKNNNKLLMIDEYDDKNIDKIFYDNIHLKKYGHEYISKIILQNIENELTK